VTSVLDPADALTLLREGSLDLVGRLVDASNATLYCHVEQDGVSAACVYKPVQGERPLWDFPDGTLAGREVAAYEVSEALGWDLVPPTVLREGPFGPGMCQLWIDVDESVDPRALVRSEHPDLRRMAVLDAVINNADRKGGHLLPSGERVWGIDHGVCFSVDDKLRTLLWQWEGQALTPEALSRLAAVQEDLRGALGETLRGLLTRREVARTAQRIDALLRSQTYPSPSPHWPALPWPPF
jgi:hypothetical protein